jgi:hypothetical protein
MHMLSWTTKQERDCWCVLHNCCLHHILAVARLSARQHMHLCRMNGLSLEAECCTLYAPVLQRGNVTITLIMML